VIRAAVRHGLRGPWVSRAGLQGSMLLMSAMRALLNRQPVCVYETTRRIARRLL